MKQGIMKLKPFFNKTGAAFYLVGSLVFYISSSYSISKWSIVLMVLGICLVVLDAVVTLFKAGEGGLDFNKVMPWIFAIISLLLFFVANAIELPPEKLGGVQSSFLGRLKFLLQFLYVFTYIASLIYRFMLSLLQGGVEQGRTDFLIQRQEYFKKSWLSIIVFLVVVVLLNYLSYVRNPSWDLSPNLYSFGPASRIVIKAINQEVKIHAFLPELQAVKLKNGKFTPNELYRISNDVKLYLDQLSALNSKINVVYHNADLEAYDSNEFGNVNNGTIVIRATKKEIRTLNVNDKPYTERRVYLTTVRDLARIEKDLVRALVHVASETKIVYFASSNGERFSMAGEQNLGSTLNSLKEQLLFYNFKVEKLEQKDGGFEIPKDADVVALVGSTVPYGEKAKEDLLKYLKDGGAIFIAIEPQNQGRGNKTEEYSWLLEKFGGKPYRFVGGLVTNTNLNGLLVTDNIESHSLTDNIKKLPSPVLAMPQMSYFEEGKNIPKNVTIVTTPSVAGGVASVLEEKKEKSVVKITVKGKKEEVFLKKQPVKELVELEPLELLYSPNNAYIDENKNNKNDTKERKGRFLLGLAYEKQKFPASPRVVLYSGTDWLSERGVRFPIAQYNLQMATDSFLWLVESPLAGVLSAVEKPVRNVQLSDELKWKLMLYGMIIFPIVMALGMSYGIYYYRNKTTHFK